MKQNSDWSLKLDKYEVTLNEEHKLPDGASQNEHNNVLGPACLRSMLHLDTNSYKEALDAGSSSAFLK